MSEGRLPFPLPLDEVWAVAGWRGPRSFFRNGWTGLASDRLRVYHLPVGDGQDECIEVTTFVSGHWLGEDHLDFELEHQGRQHGSSSSYRECMIDLGGSPTPFQVAEQRGIWAGLSEGVEPVVTLLVCGVAPADLVLETVRSDRIEGFDRFADR